MDRTSLRLGGIKSACVLGLVMTGGDEHRLDFGENTTLGGARHTSKPIRQDCCVALMREIAMNKYFPYVGNLTVRTHCGHRQLFRQNVLDQIVLFALSGIVLDVRYG